MSEAKQLSTEYGDIKNRETAVNLTGDIMNNLPDLTEKQRTALKTNLALKDLVAEADTKKKKDTASEPQLNMAA